MKRVVQWICAAAAVLCLSSASAQWPGNPMLFASSAAFALQKSIVLNGSTQYLSRTFGTPTSGQKWTVNVWLKRASTTDVGQSIFATSGGSVANNEIGFCGTSAGMCAAQASTFSGYVTGQVQQVGTTSTFTNTSDWYNFQVAVDTTQATAANRIHIYVDGVEGSYGTTTYPAQNSTIEFNTAFQHWIGQSPGLSAWFYNGKMAAYYFVDGQQLTPTSFVSGSGHLTTHPIKYTGTLGSNGFVLMFCGAAIGGDDGTGAQCSNAGSNTWTATGSPTTSTDVPS